MPLNLPPESQKHFKHRKIVSSTNQS